MSADVPCRKCSYNLRGLALEGRCPECGSPVGLSIKGDLLRFSDPRWVLTLRRGTRLILTGIAVIVAGVVLGVVAAMLQASASIAVGAGLGEWVTAGAGLVGYLLVLFGSWLLTEPDPSGLGEREYGTTRRIIRVSLAAGVLSALVEFVATVAPSGGTTGLAIEILQFLLGIVNVIGTFAQFLYLNRLALRIPDYDLAARAHFLMYAIGISYSILIVFALGSAILIRTSAAGSPGPLVGLGCFMAIVGLALLVFGVMYLFLLWRLGSRFGEEIAFARASWAGSR